MTENTRTDRSDESAPRARRPVAAVERARVAELHAAGLSRAAIARDLGRSADTVGRIAADLDLSFDRSRTAVAVAAKQVDNRARRAALISRAYDEAGAALDAMRASPDGYLASGTAASGATVITRVPIVPPHDRKALAATFATLTGSAARMEAVDGGTDIENAKSMLGQLGEALAIVVDGTRRADG